MKEIKNLEYGIQVEYINTSGQPVMISRKICDNGLETNIIQVGDICITEETIKGRVLSGRLDNKDFYCGFKYDYEKFQGEKPENINEDVEFFSGVNLINKTKNNNDFLGAKMVFSSLIRNDYRVVSLPYGTIQTTKTVTATNGNLEGCSYTETASLLKTEGDDRFAVVHKEKTYAVGDACVTEEVVEGETADLDNDIKLETKDLVAILNQNPLDYRALQGLTLSAYPTETQDQ